MLPASNDPKGDTSMGMENGVTPLPDEDPIWGKTRFVCDHCGEAMLSRDGVAIALPVEYGGVAEEGLLELTSSGETKPAPRRYYVHRVDCEWHFIHEHGWTPDDYSSADIALKD
jgi:hypothetical protein